MRVEAWKQLTEEYGQWNMYQDKEFMTSVDTEKYQGNQKYNESLKDFIKPAIQNVNLKKNKYDKRIKAYSQVLGINVKSNEEKKKESNNKTNTTKKVKV